MTRILRSATILSLLGFVLFSCNNDDDTQPVNNGIKQTKEFLNDAQANTILLLDTFHMPAKYSLVFESGDTIKLPKANVESLELDRANWKATVEYKDGEIQIIPLLGAFSISNTDVNLNPNGSTPLSAKVEMTTPVDGRFKVVVSGKNGAQSDVELFPEYYGKTHVISIHGLYFSHNNTVDIIFTNNDGYERLTNQVQIQTVSELNYLPTLKVNVSQPDQMEEGLTFISYLGVNTPHRPFMVDAFGDVRWVLDVSADPTVGNIHYDNGMEKLENGNLFFGNRADHSITEIDWFGTVVNTWSLAPYHFHHNVIEKPNGNFLASVSLPGSMHLYGVETVEDYIVEIDRTSGGIVTEWDLKQSLDETRFALTTDTFDWMHVNSVWHDESDNTIIVSGRTQGTVKLTYDNKVKWIISAHKGWGSARNGDNMNNFLLNPLDASGNVISDTAVINGNAEHSEFEWPWYQHATKITRNGNLTLFDNGSTRQFGNTSDKYSRAVEYEINEQAMTIRQVWAYGKSRGLETYSAVVSDVDYLPGMDNILFSPGFRVENAAGQGAKVVEVDYLSGQPVFELEITPDNAPIGLHRAERMKF